MSKKDLIKKIQNKQKERLLNIGYSEKQVEFLNDIVDVILFRGLPSRIVLRNGTELYL